VNFLDEHKNFEKRLNDLEKEFVLLKETITPKEINRATVPNDKKEKEIRKVEDIPIPSFSFNWATFEQIWLPRIFIFILLLGVIWGFKVAVDGGYINEPVRIIIGFLFSGLLIYFGEKNIKHSRNALGQSLLGGSIVLLMLTTFAMHNLYGMITPFVAFGLNVIWILGGIFLAHRHNSQSLAIIAALGGYLIPFLIESKESSTIMFVSYAVFLYLSLLYFSMKQNFTILYYVSAGLLHIVFLFFLAVVPNVNAEILVIGILVQHLFLLLNLFLNNIKNQVVTIFTSFTLTVFWVFGTLNDEYVTNILISLTIVYILSTYMIWAKKIQVTPLALPVISSTAMFSFSLFLSQLVKEEVDLIIILIQGAISLYLGFKTKSIFNLVTGSILYVLSTVIILVKGFDEIISIEMLSWVFVLFTLGFICHYSKLYNKQLYSNLFFALALYILVFVTYITLSLTATYESSIQYLAVSFIWIVYSISSIIYGVTKNNKDVRIIGVALIIITLLKLIFVDLPNVSLLVRAILFIGFGGIGLFISRVFYKK
jgi:uncharacterized membrane protein